MRGTREQVAEKRRLIVETASRLFRIHGFDGVTIAEIMQEAGLTHGGFYGHFASKAALAAEASRFAFERSTDRWAGIRSRGPDAFATIIGHYLSLAHVDSPGEGCITPALCADVDRAGDPGLAETFARGIEALSAELAATLPAPDGERSLDDGLHALAALAGAVILARSVRDRTLAERILAATRDRLQPALAPSERT